MIDKKKRFKEGQSFYYNRKTNACCLIDKIKAYNLCSSFKLPSKIKSANYSDWIKEEKFNWKTDRGFYASKVKEDCFIVVGIDKTIEDLLRYTGLSEDRYLETVDKVDNFILTKFKIEGKLSFPNGTYNLYKIEDNDKKSLIISAKGNFNMNNHKYTLSDVKGQEVGFLQGYMNNYVYIDSLHNKQKNITPFGCVEDGVTAEHSTFGLKKVFKKNANIIATETQKILALLYQSNIEFYLKDLDILLDILLVSIAEQCKDNDVRSMQTVQHTSYNRY